MAVNLEELALKSVEQYAALNVRLSSMEDTILEIHRKNENREEKFIIACDKLSRLEEKFVGMIEDRAATNKRVDDLSKDVDSLANSVRELMIIVNTQNEKLVVHQQDHCDNCPYSDPIKELKETVKTLSAKVESLHDKDIQEVRSLITTPWGMLWLRVMTSKWGKWWMGIVSANVVLAVIIHFEVIKWLVNLVKPVIHFFL